MIEDEILELSMQFVADEKYADSLTKIASKAKKYNNLYNCDLGATLGFNLCEEQIRIWYNTKHETKQSVYVIEDIKRCQIYSNGCLLLFKDKNFVFLPITDNEENDINLFSICETLENELDGFHFFVIERMDFLVDETKSKRIKVGFAIGDSPIATIVMAVLGIVMATFFVTMQKDYAFVQPSACEFYVGSFEKYIVDSKNYIDLYFADEKMFSVHHACGTEAFFEKLDTVNIGEQMKITLNPNVDYVIEISTNTKEILNFEASQEAMQKEVKAFMWFAVILYGGAVYLIVYGIYKLIKEKRVNKE